LKKIKSLIKDGIVIHSQSFSVSENIKIISVLKMRGLILSRVNYTKGDITECFFWNMPVKRKLLFLEKLKILKFVNFSFFKVGKKESLFLFSDSSQKIDPWPVLRTLFLSEG
jgi:hypothetical protein